MSRIREKATESEAVVRNITREIQVLDLAKKNLILSMTTLKRLQMLGTWRPSTYHPTIPHANTQVNALSQLEDQTKERKYHEIVQSLAVGHVVALAYSSETHVRC